MRSWTWRSTPNCTAGRFSYRGSRTDPPIVRYRGHAASRSPATWNWPGVIGGSQEFAHIHPDGSMHVWLSVDSAVEVDVNKWGEFHPWVGRDGFWDGVVMIYTPETLDEVDVAIEILVDAYNFVTGADVSPADIA